MDWLELTIKTAHQGIEPVSAMLTAAGVEGCIIDDEEDFNEFLRDNRDYWDYVDDELAGSMRGLSQLRLYIPSDGDAPAFISDLKARLSSLKELFPDAELGSLELTVAGLKSEDWENSWKKYYAPLPIGKNLLVMPRWLEPEPGESRTVVSLDPGMIFGTGAHASTQMCMAELENHIHGGERVLDLGCGSAILSITALLLGAANSVGLDIDPKAEDIARENAALNGLLSDRFTAMTGNVIGDSELIAQLGSFDIVLANIVADVIIPLAPTVPSLLSHGGRFICSGILDVRLGEVLSALEGSGLIVDCVNSQEDWRQITAHCG